MSPHLDVLLPKSLRFNGLCLLYLDSRSQYLDDLPPYPTCRTCRLNCLGLSLLTVYFSRSPCMDVLPTYHLCKQSSMTRLTLLLGVYISRSPYRDVLPPDPLCRPCRSDCLGLRTQQSLLAAGRNSKNKTKINYLR